MRIAYFLSQDLSKPSGVLRKCASQVQIWQKNGHEVKLFVINSSAPLRAWFQRVPIQTFQPRSDSKNPGKVLSNYYQMLAKVARDASAYDPDIIYIRKMPFAPAMVRLMRSVPSVIELNTIYNREYRAISSLFSQVYNVLTEPLVFRASSGLIPVTQEIASTVQHHRKPLRVISNGIDLSDIEALPAPPSSVKHFVFVGTPGWPWHGLDKITAIARRMNDWHFDIIGFEPKELPSPLAELLNIQAHGLMSPAQYRQLMARATVALGTLALHRINMTENCSLKVRDYLSVGLPVIMGNKDTDFPNGAWFLLQLPNSETNTRDHIEHIVAYVQSVRGRRVNRSEIGHLDHRVQEPIRLSFFAEIAGSKNRNQ